jgi:hypothetical protein
MLTSRFLLYVVLVCLKTLGGNSANAPLKGDGDKSIFVCLLLFHVHHYVFLEKLAGDYNYRSRLLRNSTIPWTRFSIVLFYFYTINESIRCNFHGSVINHE